ncbi:NADP-dependent oxidoreductase [Fructobacillus ficulneus]|uniref:NADPH-quinone alcohol dehydrogenase, Zn-dependent n=1 Tax=Fructobacillus ficulneus TaxID=157463 RepID=A0A0K8MKC0_9LACO|nr:NADP-dependent oxidoreductase [Fructobacillus ficulneus]GAP00340.1 NADPH-quinone alcohol dehydrogenase, Zn-dependent [Fructobacillus ficulneus]
MKAAQLDRYSKDFTLNVREVPVPAINDDEVLVKVKEAAVNPLEKLIGTGSVKLIQDYDLPATMGNEFSGVVDQVGSNVYDFQVGDSIYARMPLNKIGAFAEYVAIKADEISLLPTNLDFKTGAATALTALTAYQGLLEDLQVEAGKTLFIAGGSGSFGQLAIPLAKSMGLKVIVSGSSQFADQAQAMGVDQYLPYQTENYWEKLQNIDYVIDTLGPAEFDHELAVLKPGGRLLSLKTGPNKKFAVDHNFSFAKRMLFTLAGAKYDKKAQKKGVSYHFIFVRSSGDQLRQISRIIEEKNIVPSVDPNTFTIEEVNQALDLVFNGHPNGKVLISF